MKNNSGLSLVELLITVTIIGILSSILIVSFGGSRERAKDSAVIASVTSLRPKAVEEQLARTAPTGTKICNEVHKTLKGDNSLVDGNWTSSAGCLGNQVDEHKVCCASNKREWVIWGQLSTYDTSATANTGGKDIYCADDDGFLGEVDFTAAPGTEGTADDKANGDGQFVVGPLSGSTNLKCE